MPRYKDEPRAVRVYTVCDESRYLIVRNVPALGCGDELQRLFSNHGDIEECKPMDAADCEAYTDVFWIKFHFVSNARFAKRKLDEYNFLGNRLDVSYAPQFETLEDTKEKLESRRNEVLARLNSGRAKVSAASLKTRESQGNFRGQRVSGDQELRSHLRHAPVARVSSDKEYFPSQSMNQAVRSVREKLNKIQSSGDRIQHGSASKKARVDIGKRK